ncbi:hypothetical protein BH11BAC6_BH11BAC6_18420 [soil metagenome]
MPHALRFIVNIFLIAVVVNTAVVSAHILTAYKHIDTEREFNTQESFNIILLIAGISIIIFLASVVLVYIFAGLLKQMKRDRSFWMLMIVGVTAAYIAATFFKATFAAYNNETNQICAIAGFSIMVSLAFEYQFFLGETEAEEIVVQ